MSRNIIYCVWFKVVSSRFLTQRLFVKERFNWTHTYGHNAEQENLITFNLIENILL